MNFKRYKYDEYGSRNDSQKSVVKANVDKNDSQNDSQKSKITLRREKILNLLRYNSNTTASDLSKILEVSISTVNRDIEWLRKNDVLEYIGSSKGGKWVVKL